MSGLTDVKSACLRVIEHLPYTDTFLCSLFHHLRECGVSDTPCGIVDDALDGFLVVGVCHHAIVGDDVLYLLALIKAQSAVNPVRDILLAHIFLKTAALGIGAIEDGKVTVGASLSASEP